MKKTFIYKDLLNDDFAGTNIKQKDLPDNFKYISKNPLWNAASFVFYRLIATPLVFLFQKILYGQRIKNRKVLRKYLKEGYFLYSNHTLTAGDAFTPTLTAFPKKAYILVSPDAFSIPVVKGMVKMLGGMPIPSKISEVKPFRDAINARSQKGDVLVIYPEAHIWPYYTKIRPFKDASFKYPAENGKAVFCITNTFKKHFLYSFPVVTSYIDGPFLPDKDLSVKENQRNLRNAVYQTMVKRSKTSSYEHCLYVDGTKQDAPKEQKHAQEGSAADAKRSFALAAPLMEEGQARQGEISKNAAVFKLRQDLPQNQEQDKKGEEKPFSADEERVSPAAQAAAGQSPAS